MPRPHTQRPLSREDHAAWLAFASGIARLPGRARPDRPAADQAPLDRPHPGQAPAAPARPPAVVSAAPGPPRDPSPGLRLGASADPRSPPAGLDRGTWRRLHAGRMPTEATLDLHGRTARDAHRSLRDFVLAGHAARYRCVEVITGRGRGEGGVLRRELPHWLDDPALRRLVVAALYPPANPGCVRLLLRRHRP